MALTEHERRTLARMIEFLSPKDYTLFFEALKSGNIAKWESNLMVDLSK
jgi:hypothetical protein